MHTTHCLFHATPGAYLNSHLSRQDAQFRSICGRDFQLPYLSTIVCLVMTVGGPKLLYIPPYHPKVQPGANRFAHGVKELMYAAVVYRALTGCLGLHVYCEPSKKFMAAEIGLKSLLLLRKWKCSLRISFPCKVIVDTLVGTST